MILKGRETMINPYELKDERALGLIQGYVIDVKDKGDCNMLLFKKDTMYRASDLISVAAWAPERRTGRGTLCHERGPSEHGHQCYRRRRLFL